MKKTLITLFSVLCMFTMQAQVEFMHEGGAALYFGNEIAAPAIMYSPRLNISEIGDGTFSIGAHPALGFYLSSNDYYGENFIIIDLPFLAEVNFGYGASDNNDDGVGVYAGAGLGVSIFSTSYAGGSGFGPVANAGFRFPLQGRPLDLRVAYDLDLIEDDFGNTTSFLIIGLSYIIGFE